MNKYWNDDLRRRQQAGDVGFLGQPGRRYVTRKAMYVMAGLVLLGLVLLYASPVPGLGFFLILGGLGGAFMTYAAGWLGR